MNHSNIFLIFTLLQLKHFIADFLLQFPFMYKNKGIYGHDGGVIHAHIHGIFTFLIFLCFFDFPNALLALCMDFVLHYHIDYFKVKLNQKYNLKPDNSEKYWWLLGFDQLLHQLTYIGLIILVILY